MTAAGQTPYSYQWRFNGVDIPGATNSSLAVSNATLTAAFVTPTRESDMHLLAPWEFHAETTRLVQMLRGGHHTVHLPALDEEAVRATSSRPKAAKKTTGDGVQLSADRKKVTIEATIDDFFENNTAPYPVYKVADDTLVPANMA